MQFSLEQGKGKYTIQAYQMGELIINQHSYHHSLLVSPKQLQAWRPQKVDDITAADLKVILALQPEVILIGTGDELHFLKTELMLLFYQQHIGIECMSTAAACRTYNVLLAEGRNVAAGLIV